MMKIRGLATEPWGTPLEKVYEDKTHSKQKE